jgi:hypothetical protein
VLEREGETEPTAEGVADIACPTRRRGEHRGRVVEVERMTVTRRAVVGQVHGEQLVVAFEVAGDTLPGAARLGEAVNEHYWWTRTAALEGERRGDRRRRHGR